MPEVRINIKTVQEGDNEIPKVNKGLNETIGILQKQAVAVAAVGLTFKKAFDLSEQGANLNQLADSFDLLNQNILKTPDLLEDMQAASRGTMTDAQLMQGVLKLVAGTSTDMAQQLAAASPQLIEIAKAAQKLNPTLGDTAFLYESITTGIKRGSPMILDNLGIVIKVEEAYQKYAASIGKTANKLNAEEKSLAILNATLKSGDALINQVGGSVDSQTDSWARMRVQVEENTNAFKQYLADGLQPVMQATGGDYGQTVDNMIAANVAAAQSLDELVNEGQKMSNVFGMGGGLAAAITGTEDEIRAGIEQTTRAMAVQADSAEEFSAALDQAFTGRAHQALQTHLKDIGMTEQAYYELIQAGESVAGSDQAMIATAAYLTTQMQEVNEVVSYGSDLQDRYAERAMAAADGSRAFGIALEEQRAATIAANAALVSGFEAAEEPVQAFLDAQKLASESQGEWVQYTRTSATEIADISSQLAGDLDEDQRKAWEEILSTTSEGSAEWLGAWKALQGDLTATQRAELVAQKADLEAAGDTIGSAYTGSIEDMAAAKEAALAANAEIIASYQQLALEGSLAIAEASPDPEAFDRALEYAVAIGAITQEEADLRTEVANTRTAIDELNQMVGDGTITTETAAKAYELLTEGEATAADEAVRLAEEGGKIGQGFLNSLPGIDEVINRLDSIDGRTVRATVEVTTEYSGDLGSGYTGGGKSSSNGGDEGGTTGSGDEGSTPGGGGMALGGLVTGGILGKDSVSKMLMPGERVLTVAQNKEYEKNRGKADNRSFTWNIFTDKFDAEREQRNAAAMVGGI